MKPPTTPAVADRPNPADDPVEGPLCLHCLDPCTRLDHYCPNCGETVGPYTGYLPVVNIPFQYHFYGRVWEGVWRGPGMHAARRLGYGLLLVLCAPEMFVGLPFLLWERLRPRDSGPVDAGSPRSPRATR